MMRAERTMKGMIRKGLHVLYDVAPAPSEPPPWPSATYNRPTRQEVPISEPTLRNDAQAREAKRLIGLAIDVFDDVGKALEWFQQPNRGLGGKTPIETSATDPQSVERVLYQTEYGTVPDQ